MIVAIVTHQARHVAWFADVHHADAFADLLRSRGAWGVEVIEHGDMPADPTTCDECMRPAVLCERCASGECNECSDVATHCEQHGRDLATALADRVRAAIALDVDAPAMRDAVADALDGA